MERAPARLAFANPVQLVWYALIGLACRAVGPIHIATFYRFTDRYREVSLPRPLSGNSSTGP